MKPRPPSIDSTEIYGNVLFVFFLLVNPSDTHTHTPHAVQYLPTPTAFLMQLPLGRENVWQALKWVWVVNWIRAGCGICQNGRCTAVSVWTAAIGSLCDGQCCTFWLLLHTKCPQSTSLWLVYEIGVTKKINYWTARWTEPDTHLK